MRLRAGVGLLLIVLASLVMVAYSAAPEVFTTESNKLKTLRQMEKAQGLIEFEDVSSGLTEFVLQGPRDYNVILSITSGTDKLPCQICQEWNPTFGRVARTHSTMEKKSGRLFFVQVDVADLSKELLKTLQGKVPGLPFVAKIPSTKSKATRLETAERGVYYTVNEDDVAFAVWVNTHSDAHIRIVNYKRIIIVSLALVILAAIGYIKFSFFWGLARNPMAYFAACLVGYCVVCGGTVFNIIHKSPFFGFDGRGGPMWIIPSPREQLGAEGLVMAAVVGGAALGWVALAGPLPNSNRPRWKILAALATTFAIMLIGRRLFLWKHPYYPY